MIAQAPKLTKGTGSDSQPDTAQSSAGVDSGRETENSDTMIVAIPTIKVPSKDAKRCRYQRTRV